MKIPTIYVIDDNANKWSYVTTNTTLVHTMIDNCLSRLKSIRLSKIEYSRDEELYKHYYYQLDDTDQNVLDYLNQKQ